MSINRGTGKPGHAAVHGVVKSQTRLGNRTTATNCFSPLASWGERDSILQILKKGVQRIVTSQNYKAKGEGVRLHFSLTTNPSSFLLRSLLRLERNISVFHLKIHHLISILWVTIFLHSNTCEISGCHRLRVLVFLHKFLGFKCYI